MKRRRQAGGWATWLVTVAALIGVWLLLSTSFAEIYTVTLIVLVLYVGWAMIVSAVCRINVLAILWGRSVEETDEPTRPAVLRWSTLALALLPIGLLIADLLNDGFSTGWYGVLGAINGLVVLYLLARSRQGTIGRLHDLDARTGRRERESPSSPDQRR